jgi:UDP-glucose 4-epimerase
MSRSGTVLVTGAAGYLGSHAMAALLRSGRMAVGVDSYRNSSPLVSEALERLCGQRPHIVRADLRDIDACSRIFDEHDIDAVMHFAGLKSVSESVADPILYYGHNLGSTTSLLAAMQANDVTRLVFSSSCTVYGNPPRVPVDESMPSRPISPYGVSKSMIERMLEDLCAADPRWQVLSLRYFNPIGADPSGLIGEDPSVAPTTVMPRLVRAAIGGGTPLDVYGDDYPTPDGTCIRDYIHVCDLIDGHLAALDALSEEAGFQALNLGTGRGISVLELIRTCSQVTGRDIPYRVVGRRLGDAAVVYADPRRAQEVLGWRANRTLTDACADHHRWQAAHPDGYDAGSATRALGRSA